MGFFDNLDGIFRKWSDVDEYTRTLMTLATALGIILSVLIVARLLWSCIQGFRLYIFNQCCHTTDYRKKYGQWALITGSTDGIGLSMAKELAKRGHSIIVVGRSEEKLASTRALLESIENVGEILTVVIDLSDLSTNNYERVRNEINPDVRDIGILINNAGVFPSNFNRFCEGDLVFLRNIMNVNIIAPVLITRMIMPGMLKRDRGLVVNVSSLCGAMPTPYTSVYGPSKTFLDAFSEMLQIEYSSHPVDIINLTPGAVTTKLFLKAAKLERPSPFNPTPDDYARSAINALATGIGSISGTIAHGFSQRMSSFFNTLGLIPLIFRINLTLNARDVDIKPYVRYKRPEVHEEETALSNESALPRQA